MEIVLGVNLGGNDIRFWAVVLLYVYGPLTGGLLGLATFACGISVPGSGRKRSARLFALAGYATLSLPLNLVLCAVHTAGCRTATTRSGLVASACCLGVTVAGLVWPFLIRWRSAQQRLPPLSPMEPACPDDNAPAHD